MKISRRISIQDVGALVCESLKRHGIDAILTGGAVVSIYTDNEYESYDLDFIIPGLAKKVDKAMLELGFEKGAGRHWIHPNSDYFVEFPGSVLMIGESTKAEVIELQSRAGTLKLLSPTDSVMDRLAAFYHWDDFQCLDQAVMIAKRHPVNLKKIRRWSTHEGVSDKFQKFMALVSSE